jgi:hypothetical protein
MRRQRQEDLNFEAILGETLDQKKKKIERKKRRQ